jgi:SAM-dependent methyltransferase
VTDRSTLSERTADVFAGSGLLAPGARRLAAARLRTRCGQTLPFSAARWHAPAAAEEVEVLDQVRGPVLDLACGPGRLVRHLLDRGIVAVGVDTAPDAVAAAQRQGVPVVLADLWQDLPLEGAWETVLLFDGNIGIGAAPDALLARCRQLLAPSGGVVVEVGPPGTATTTVEARIEWNGWRSGWFKWATVSLADVQALAGEAGLSLRWVHARGGRIFARLEVATIAGVTAEPDQDSGERDEDAAA